MNFTDLQKYNKFWVALIVGAVVAGLKHFNFPIDQTFQDSLGVIVTAGLVFLVPNKKA